MSADEIAYWDAEARDDPRYAAACWGMDESDDADATIEQILSILDKGMPDTDGTIVEIGCGPGRLLLRMAERYGDGEFHGIEISPAMTELFIHQNLYEWGCGNAHIGDNWALTEVGTVDLVYCVELFQHLNNEAVLDYIGQAHRALRPGGKFIAQFVLRGEPGPHSFPRSWDAVHSMFRPDQWHLIRCEQHVHQDWLWVTATKG